MLIIRDQQMRAFELSLFEDWLVGHLQRHFPDKCLEMDATKINDFIAIGLQKARSHGFYEEPHICHYIDLMMVFGQDFDSNPQLPWVGNILHNPSSITAPDQRVEMLHEAACEYLDTLEDAFVENQKEGTNGIF
jgi:hypothetical protein